MTLPFPDDAAMALLQRGVTIPASPLALDGERRHDRRRQRALYRYYAAAGAGGVAVAVHTTQFEIREPRHGLLEPVLRLASETLCDQETSCCRRILKIAGICGITDQATGEARHARSLGYDAGLLSLAALRSASEDELLGHCAAVSREIPLIGFYLQSAVGGGMLPYTFWNRFAAIPNVVAIKIAPFNRYQTLDVVRAVADSGRSDEITLYTGNDDNIIADLVTPFVVAGPRGEVELRIRGGLLGQWTVWTRTFAQLLEEVHAVVNSGAAVPPALLAKNAQLTDANGVVFDAAHGFAGCIPGIHEILRRQGLLENNHCLNPHEALSPGQAEEITRVCLEYPWLPDDTFVRAHLDEWLA